MGHIGRSYSGSVNQSLRMVPVFMGPSDWEFGLINLRTRRTIMVCEQAWASSLVGNSGHSALSWSWSSQALLLYPNTRKKVKVCFRAFYKHSHGWIGFLMMQSIFTAYRHPFVLTWLGASLLIVYLPISLLNDQIKSCIVKARKNPGTFSPLAQTDSPLKSPLKNGRKSSDLELQHLILKKDSDLDLEADEEASFIRADNAHPAKNHGRLISWDLIKVSFTLAPLWFLTEYLSNGALALTSVASTTILSSTAGLFTLVFGTILGQDSFNISKAVAVIMTITGVAMTTLGKTWSTEEAENAIDTSVVEEHSLWGDALGLCSAVSYGLFTILLKKSAGEGGSHVDMQRIFGYIGLFTLFGLWWLIWPLSWFGFEPVFSLPTTMKVDEVLLANGILGSVVSDYFWALSVVWTTPLVATLGMSLTIPLAMVADMVVHGRHYSGIYVLGSLQVFAGFVIANLTDQCTRKIGL